MFSVPSQLIVHAGDIGAPEILERLRRLAPVVAVRGNTDGGRWAAALPESATVEVAGVRLYVLHDVADLHLDPAASRFSVVVSGHSHRPSVERRDGVLFVNPGSIGPRRFQLPIAMALLRISGPELEVQQIELSVQD